MSSSSLIRDHCDHTAPQSIESEAKVHWIHIDSILVAKVKLSSPSSTDLTVSSTPLTNLILARAFIGEYRAAAFSSINLIQRGHRDDLPIFHTLEPDKVRPAT